MKQYANLLEDILCYGFDAKAARENMPGTKVLIDREIRISDGRLPILMYKRVFFDKVLHELIWFLKGDTNIKYLIDNDVNIWNEDAYRYYCNLCKEQKLEAYDYNDWIQAIKNTVDGRAICHVNSNGKESYLEHGDTTLYVMGDCGRIYGYQWRSYGVDNIHVCPQLGELTDRKSVDQIQNLINGLITTPDSRYHIVDAWNPQDMHEGLQALPACHTGFKCAVEYNNEGTKYLSLSVEQRSCDMFLGVPFNLLSYGILHRILCVLTGYAVGQFVWHGFNCHIYENQTNAVEIYLDRLRVYHASSKRPTLIIDDSNWETIDDIKFEDFKLEDYEPMAYIAAPLSTGLIKK